MIKYFLLREIGRFERETGEDASYGRDLVGEMPWGVLFLFLMKEAVRRPRGVGVEVWHAAHLGAAVASDCGPCAQLAVMMATKEGVSGEVLKALLAGELGAVGEEVRVAYLYARYVIERSPLAEGLREGLVFRYGEAAALRIGFQVALGNFFPVLKRALGHARACTLVRVGDEAVAVRQDGAEAPGVRRVWAWA